MKYVTIGSTFSGNKGAASILEAAIQTITARDKNAEFTVLTVYPEEDKKFNHYSNVKILSAKPMVLGLIINPLSFLYKFLLPLRPLLRKQSQIRAIAEADVLLDHGGISFVDGREKFLIYNVATMLPAIFMKTRIVKCSQAMGPFNSWINRSLAKLILPRIDVICSRGKVTHKYLRQLGLKNVTYSTDYAFLMDMFEPEKKSADKELEASGYKFNNKGKSIGILPSEVVRKKVEASGTDYVGRSAEFINQLLEQGYTILLMAYSARRGKTSQHNNDLPVCREIAAKINHKNFTFIDDELSAQQLRHIISRLDMIVASRFHAMVASLSVATPPLIIGWSHKYAEVMSSFGLEDCALGYDAFDGDILMKNFKKIVGKQMSIKTKIKNKLPEVKNNAGIQVELILSDSK